MLNRDEAKVRCYGCGMTYNVLGSWGRGEESERHCKHTGDTGLTREQLLAWINEVQEERDEWIATAFAVEG